MINLIGVRITDFSVTYSRQIAPLDAPKGRFFPETPDKTGGRRDFSRRAPHFEKPKKRIFPNLLS
jgi:hypothetical protein